MSRSKHQTFKSISEGRSKLQLTAMFAERDDDALEWVAKSAIKKGASRGRRDGRRAPAGSDGHVSAPDDGEI